MCNKKELRRSFRIVAIFLFVFMFGGAGAILLYGSHRVDNDLVLQKIQNQHPHPEQVGWVKISERRFFSAVAHSYEVTPQGKLTVFTYKVNTTPKGVSVRLQ